MSDIWFTRGQECQCLEAYVSNEQQIPTCLQRSNVFDKDNTAPLLSGPMTPSLNQTAGIDFLKTPVTNYSEVV